MIYYFQKKGKGFKFEMCKQVRFWIVNGNGEMESFGGIGIYNDDNTLVNIICGHCGEMFEPEEVVGVDEFEYWVDINEEIIGENHW